MRHIGAFLLVCFTICGCAAGQERYISYLQGKDISPLSIDNFQQCRGYGCKKISNVTLSETDWKEIDSIFSLAPKNAQEERNKIAKAIGTFETKVGAITGTSEDQYGTFRKLGQFQLDCVDESTNTTIYLSLLNSRGLINFHRIEAPTVRLPIINAGRWPHQTAVITEVATDESYVVDSWFHDNGYPAEIVTLSEWKKGWKPKEHLRNENL